MKNTGTINNATINNMTRQKQQGRQELVHDVKGKLHDKSGNCKTTEEQNRSRKPGGTSVKVKMIIPDLR
jgi:hypothetical protein